ncbi:hypothetical protein HDU84_008352 [Entophlyctis sp. JEL0112]|nr:hypothetical protein HDU84_008352 [Entophlyctis sp. JEL0112]
MTLLLDAATYIRKAQSADVPGRQAVLISFAEKDDPVCARFISDVLESSIARSVLLQDIRSLSSSHKHAESARGRLVFVLVALACSAGESPLFSTATSELAGNCVDQLAKDGVWEIARLPTRQLLPLSPVDHSAARILFSDAVSALHKLAPTAAAAGISAEVDSCYDVSSAESIALRAFAWLELYSSADCGPSDDAMDIDGNIDVLRSSRAVLNAFGEAEQTDFGPILAFLGPLFDCVLVTSVGSSQTNSSENFPVDDMVRFLFANLTSRSHEKLFAICITFATFLAKSGKPRVKSAFEQSLKKQTENAIQNLLAVESVFGFASLLLLDTKVTTMGQSPTAQKENYHDWLAGAMSKATRRVHQFVTSLLRDIFSIAPHTFNIATVQALREVAASNTACKQLLNDIKTHLVDPATGVDSLVLAAAGLASSRGSTSGRLTFAVVLEEFIKTGSVPKSLYVEILVNDSWYKSQFLPALFSRTTDDKWESQQLLIEHLRRANRIPKSFLSAMTETKAPEYSSLSLKDFAAVIERLETALQVLNSLDISNSDNGELHRECTEGTANLFREIERLFNSDCVRDTNGRLYVDAFGELCVFGDARILCTPETLSVAETILEACAGAGVGTLPTDSSTYTEYVSRKIGVIIQLFVEHMPTCLHSLILRVYSLVYGEAALDSPRQTEVLAVVLFHLFALTNDTPRLEDWSAIPNGGERLGARTQLMMFFKKYMTVECRAHVDAIAGSVAQKIDESGGGVAQAECPSPTDHLSKFANVLRKRIFRVSERRNALASRVVVFAPYADYDNTTATVADWAGSVFARLVYVRGMIDAFIRPIDEDSYDARLNAISALLKVVCEQWVVDSHRNHEGILCIAMVMSEILNSTQCSDTSKAICIAYEKVEAMHLHSFFNLFSVLSVNHLWCIGRVPHSLDPSAIKHTATFWETKFLDAVGIIPWISLNQAANLLFEGLLATINEDGALEVFLESCPTVSSILLSNSSTWFNATKLHITRVCESDCNVLEFSVTLLPKPLQKYPKIAAMAMLLRMVMESRQDALTSHFPAAPAEEHTARAAQELLRTLHAAADRGAPPEILRDAATVLAQVALRS